MCEKYLIKCITKTNTTSNTHHYEALEKLYWNMKSNIKNQSKEMKVGPSESKKMCNKTKGYQV